MVFEKAIVRRISDECLEGEMQRRNQEKSLLSAQDTEEKSDDADENLIPKGLRKNAVKISVEGAMNGFCYLVPYNGKLRDYTIKKTTGMFIPQSRNGKQKMVSVSVVEEDRIIYITKEMFKLYEKEFNKQGKISLRTSFFEKIYH